MKLNQLTTNPATVKELLKDNPKAMQFLHRQCAFDFCKPFEVVQTFGAFTLNSVKKAINAETLDNLNIYILLKCFDRCGSPERDLHAVEVNPHRVIGAQHLKEAAAYLEKHEKKTAAKDFASVEAFRKSLDEIRKHIEKAREFLTLIQPGEFHAIAAQVLPPEDIDHHESDLYIKWSSKAHDLVARLACKSLLTTFRDQRGGGLWYELPLCYNPAIGAGDR